MLRHLYAYLIGMPNNPETKSEKARQRSHVLDMAKGAVLLAIPDLLAWSIYIEGCDFELLGT